MPGVEVKGADIGIIKCNGSKFVTDRKQKVTVERRSGWGVLKVAPQVIYMSRLTGGCR
jgi:hypothetical protein